MRPDNWVIEIYKGHEIKRGFLITSFDDIPFYLKPFGIDDKVIESTRECLLEQTKNPKAFPNVILFLNNDNQPIGIEEFIKSWKRTKC
jgi:hypothetical protein